MACGVRRRTRKGLTADKIVSVCQELVLFTGLKIFTAQSTRRPRGEGNVSLGIKTLASPNGGEDSGHGNCPLPRGLQDRGSQVGGPGEDSGVHVAGKGSDRDKQLGKCWAGGPLGSLI